MNPNTPATDLAQALCPSCFVPLDFVSPHEKDCAYERQQAEGMRGMSLVEMDIQFAEALRNMAQGED